MNAQYKLKKVMKSLPDSTYRLSDEVFLYVYLLSNRAIANIYKIIKDDQEILS